MVAGPSMAGNSLRELVPPARINAPASPVVSVIVPAYNTARFIAETLASVFAQTFRDYEVIVVNDGSPDTEDLERVIAPYLQQIVYIEQQNKGVAGARNTGIRAARGEYVAFLDSDDCYLPDFLEEQLRLLEREPPADLVYANASVIGERIAATATAMEICPSEGPVSLESLLLDRCTVVTSTVVARRQALIDAELFDESFREAEDYDLWLRLAHRKARMRYQYKVLGRYRVRPGSLTSSEQRMSVSQIRVLERFQKSFDLASGTRTLFEQRLERARAFLDLTRGKEYLYEGQFAQALHCFRKANAFFRSLKLRAALVGLRFAPRLTARGVRFYWQDLLKGNRSP
jgi:glycosyltransferase involved in cell wall biosynthesis